MVMQTAAQLADMSTDSISESNDAIQVLVSAANAAVIAASSECNNVQQTLNYCEGHRTSNAEALATCSSNLDSNIAALGTCSTSLSSEEGDASNCVIAKNATQSRLNKVAGYAAQLYSSLSQTKDGLGSGFCPDQGLSGGGAV